MKLTPLADRVILKMVEVEETTKGGIILTASAKGEALRCRSHFRRPRRHGGRSRCRDDRQAR